MTKVMVFGTFDKLHKGHLNYFRQAREYGDYLIAVVARDKTVKRIKGKLPVNKQRKRLAKVRECVDKAVLGSLWNKFKVIKKYKPDVLCLGYDQEADLTKLRKLKIPVKKLKPYKPHKYKSSKIK